MGAAVSAPTQFLEQPLRRTALPLPQLGFRLQNLRQRLDPNAKLRRGLNVPCVLELGPAASDHLANRRPRHRERPHDLLDRALLLEIGAPYLADLVHAKHPHPSFPTTWIKEKDADRQLQRGSLLDAKAAPQGVIIASDFADRRTGCPARSRCADRAVSGRGRTRIATRSTGRTGLAPLGKAQCLASPRTTRFANPSNHETHRLCIPPTQNSDEPGPITGSWSGAKVLRPPHLCFTERTSIVVFV